MSTDGCRNFKTPSKIEENFWKILLFSSVFMLWFCQKSCTDKALCSISYLTEILTKQVFFRHFCKSVKGPVFTGLFGLFISYKCLILLTFWEKYFPLSSYMFSYLSKSFNHSKSVCHKGTWVRISPLAPNPCKQRLYKGFYFSKFEPALNTEEKTFANKILRVLFLSFSIAITFALFAHTLSPEFESPFLWLLRRKKRVPKHSSSFYFYTRLTVNHFISF